MSKTSFARDTFKTRISKTLKNRVVTETLTKRIFWLKKLLLTFLEVGGGGGGA